MDEQAEEVKKVVKEIPVVQDQDLFLHKTGDVYDGYFEIKKKDKIARMHGPGVYTTAEGDIYAGTWDTDRLIGASEPVTILYKDSSKYIGSFNNWGYNGPGKYIFPDNSVLKCSFLDNCPVGSLILIDPNSHEWHAKAMTGYAWFSPVNHYYSLFQNPAENPKRRTTNKLSKLHG